MMISRTVHCASLLLALAACSGTDSPLHVPPVSGASVRIVPQSMELVPGGTATLQVEVRGESGALIPAPTVQWSTISAAIATVTSTGVVTGVAVGDGRIVASSNGISDTADVRVIPVEPTGPAVEVFPEITYQEMKGWEGTAQIGEVECNPVAYNAYRQELLSRLVNELGVDRIRLHVRSGHENPTDYYTKFKTSRSTSDWFPFRYQAVNDNDDPDVIRPGGFQFAEIDHKVEAMIQPLRALLQARGEKLYVNLNYVDFGKSPWEQSSDPREYAELILATFQHLQARYGWVPDAVELVLEPDNTANWTPQVIGRAIVATGDRLAAAGYRPAFIAPSNSSMSAALADLNGVLSVPRVLEYLTDVAYHRYSGVSKATLTAIAARANQFGLRTAMLEKIAAGHEVLHEDLRDGLNSSWQQFVLGFCGSDNGGAYYVVNQSNPSSPRIVMADRSRYLRQYFSYIRFNARRIGALSGDSRLDPLAFRNTDGKLVVVVAVASAGPVPLRRLPPGSYGATFTTATQSFVQLPDMQVGTTGTAQLTMPAKGVVTIFAR